MIRFDHVLESGYCRKMLLGMYAVTTWVRSTTSLTRKSKAMLVSESALSGVFLSRKTEHSRMP